MPWYGWIALYGIMGWLAAALAILGRRQLIKERGIPASEVPWNPAISCMVMALWPLVVVYWIHSLRARRRRKKAADEWLRKIGRG